MTDLVGAAAAPIVLIDQQPYSFDELEERAFIAHMALVEMGYKQVFTAVDVAGAGRIPAGVKAVPGKSQRASVIVADLPKRIRSDVDLIVNVEDIVAFDSSYGGLRIRSTGGGICTSGWAVEKLSNGTKGLVSAGHCGGMNRVHNSNSHTMDFKAEHDDGQAIRDYGDVEWYTTNSTELPQFRANAGVIRPVKRRENTENIDSGNKYCLYSKKLNAKDCSKTVQYATSICTGTLFDGTGVTYKRMVSMSGDIGRPGDSGGPWYINNKAVGVHHGTCGNRPNKDSFSKIDLLDEALGIRVIKDD